VAIDGQPVAALLNHLKHPTDGVRHRTHVELSKHTAKEVAPALEHWIHSLDPQKKEDAHALLEALWVSQQHHLKNITLLGHLLKSPDLHARQAALTVQQHWFTQCAGHSGAPTAKGEETHAPQKKSGVLSDTPELTEVRISTVVEKMLYDVKEFTVKAGKKVRLTFANPDFMPHNLVIVKPGKADSVGMLAINLGASGFEKAFIPDSPEIVASTKLVDHGREETIEFQCPAQSGNYHFVCTFPGHHLIMRGTMIVKP
jgi:azurin